MQASGLRADRVIAISHAVAGVLVRSGVSPERISVIHSGISLEETRKATPLGVRDLLGLPRGARVAANVAALVPHKDHANLVNAASHLRRTHPELHWVIAGEGELRPDLETQIRRLGLEDRVHLMGHVLSPERLIADADVFVMSSREEGLGTAVSGGDGPWHPGCFHYCGRTPGNAGCRLRPAGPTIRS